MRICNLIAASCLAIHAGCVGVARISDFPKSAAVIDFENLRSERNSPASRGPWTFDVDSEQLVQVVGQSEDRVFAAIEDALRKSGYHIAISNRSAQAIIGERGLRANEWSSVVAVYYRARGSSFDIYVANKITQDITGGWPENRAEQVAHVLCNDLGCE